MDKKKKIITVIVSIIFIIALSLFIKFMLFPSKESTDQKNKLTIMTPEVDEKKIPHQSKLKKYKQEGAEEFQNNKTIKNLGETDTNEVDTSMTSENLFIKSNLNKLIKQDKTIGKGLAQNQRLDTNYDEEEAVNEQLKEIMKLQNETLNPSLQHLNENENEETKMILRELYSQYGLSPEEIEAMEGLDNPEQDPSKGKPQGESKIKNRQSRKKYFLKQKIIFKALHPLIMIKMS
jgi:hypothetical protein